MLNFLTSKLGIASLGVLLTLAAGGAQQWRIKSYQVELADAKVEASECRASLAIKETEAIDLNASILRQNDRIERLQLSAKADQDARAKKVLALQFQHLKNASSLTEGRGPEDLNKWLADTLR